ncbi:hypothetical protein [Cohnella faecalis]|uniref:hypothetical protein n=1 Tax=Cohnella faecalis TaxID=2315694 RepID=UPI0026BF0C09|nr:hypothetical protein [Cohnella faecalis]
MVYIDKDWIREADIKSMQKAMETGHTSSEELVGIYLERIREYDPEINSILEINPDAIELARALDAERRERGSRGLCMGFRCY